MTGVRRSRRARVLWLALCASFAWLFSALAWRAAGQGPVWLVAVWSFWALVSVAAWLPGAAAGILARPGGHRGPARNLAARDEYVIPPAPEHSQDWQTRPWRPHDPAEARIGQARNGQP